MSSLPVIRLLESSRLAPVLSQAGVCKYVNRLVRSQTLTVSFKKPLIPLALQTVAAQHAASDAERSSRWWCILSETRSVLDENPPD